jgi:protein-S-isoprenylcysteine O-methyltransferase Ste14
MNNEQTYRLLLIAGGLTILMIMMYHRLRARTGEPLDRRQEGLFMLLALRPGGLCAMGGIVAYLINPRNMAWAAAPFPAPVRWAGIALEATGAALVFWTVHTLGPNLTDTVVTRRNHTLVTTGPYRWVRHPFYLCGTLIILANGLAAANWFLIGCSVLVIALLWKRTGVEEARLVERFGDAYRDYMRHTGRFLPRSGAAA